MVINNEDLDFWIQNNLNVALIGCHGVGKSSIILDAWKRNGVNGKYFHSPTIDPFVDLIGVPRVLQGKDGEYLDFIKPKQLDYENVESLFFDEINRASRKVQDALLELILFRSINGVSFPKLKNIIVAINPVSDGDVDYNVEELDLPFLDRFDIHYEMPYDCDVDYFRNKYGKDVADPSVEWWREIPVDLRKKTFSPRRLDMLLKINSLGGDITHCAPKEIRPKLGELLKRIDSGSVLEQIHKLIKRGNDKETEKFVAKINNKDLVLNYMKEDPSIQDYFIRFIASEQLIAYWTDHSAPQETIHGLTGSVNVSSIAASIGRNLHDAKFRNRIKTIFYSGIENGVIKKIKTDTHQALCLINTSFLEGLNSSLTGKLDLNHYIDKCMLINTLYDHVNASTIEKEKVEEYLSLVDVSRDSKSSCLVKKIQWIRDHV